MAKSNRRSGAKAARERVERGAEKRSQARASDLAGYEPPGDEDRRARELLADGGKDPTPANLAMARMVIQGVDACDLIWERAKAGIEVRQLSTMVSTMTRVTNLLDKLGLTDDGAPGDLQIPIPGTGADHPKAKAKRKAKGKRPTKKAAKKSGKVSEWLD